MSDAWHAVAPVPSSTEEVQSPESSVSVQGLPRDLDSPISTTSISYNLDEVIRSDTANVLGFLDSESCNPNLLTDARSRHVGHVRENRISHKSKIARITSSTSAIEEDSARDKLRRAQHCVGICVMSWPVQYFVMAVIFFDLLITVLALSNVLEEESLIISVDDYLVTVVITADVLGRFFFEGLEFLKNKFQVFELVLVPLAICEVFVLTEANVPLPVLRAIRPILRGFRVVRQVALSGLKGAWYIQQLRHSISGSRIRFMQDGFDLDLAYVDQQMIAMPCPAVGRAAMLQNSLSQVARFFNERHPNQYLIVNTMEECTYDTKPFFNRVIQYPIASHGVPTLQGLFEMCHVLDNFLRKDSGNIIAVHSKMGQGRVTLMIIALLLFRGSHQSVTSAIPFLEHMRTQPDNRSVMAQTFDCHSQRRFLEYFSKMVSAPRQAAIARSRTATLRRLQIYGLASPHMLDLCCFTHPGSCWSRPTRHDVNKMSESVGFPSFNLLDQVGSLIDEATFDSQASGSVPSKSPPTLSSMVTPHGKANLPRTLPGSESSAQDGLHDLLAVWEPVHPTEFAGEVRLEIHRQPRKVEVRPTSDKPLLRWLGWTRCMLVLVKNLFSRFACSFWRSRFSASSGLNRFDGGMIFCFWLHTGFLEVESNDDVVASSRAVSIELNRTTVDKAAGAPTLRSISQVFKVVLEFEVDARIGWSLENSSGLRLKPAESSEECSLEWLTWVSKRIWPSFKKSFEKVIRDSMPKIQESVPRHFKINLGRCSFGDAHPTFGNVTASTKDSENLEVQLNLEFSYSTETDIVFDTSLGSFGVSHLQASGLVCVKFKPIISELPVFCALQILFLNCPDIRLTFSRGLEFANFAMVQKMLHDVVDTRLCHTLVLPHVLNINWAVREDDSTVSFRSVMPCGVLRLTIVEGRNLLKEVGSFPSAMCGTHAPDAYVKVTLALQKCQTVTVKGATNPVWGETFDFLLYDERQFFEVSARDVAFIGRHKSLGSLRVTASTLLQGGADGEWYSLGSEGSEILLIGEMYNLIADATAIEAYMDPSAVDVASGSYSFGLSESSVTLAHVPTDARSRRVSGKLNVAVLICDVEGGRLPANLDPSIVDFSLQLGDSHDQKHCAQAVQHDSRLSESTLKAIKAIEAVSSMSLRSLSADALADALGEDKHQVARVLRRRGWNLHLPDKLCLLLGEDDLDCRDVQLKLKLKGKTLASASVSLKNILQATDIGSGGLKHLAHLKGSTVAHAEMELGIRLFALVSASRGLGGNSRTLESPHSESDVGSEFSNANPSEPDSLTLI